MAKCKQRKGDKQISLREHEVAPGWGMARCERCGGTGTVPTPSEFIEAVRTAAGNHLLNANQCLTWLQDLARK